MHQGATSEREEKLCRGFARIHAGQVSRFEAQFLLTPYGKAIEAVPDTTLTNDKFAIDVNIVKREAGNVFDNIGLRYIVEVAVGKAKVFYGSILEPAQIKSILGLVGGKVADLHIAHDGRELSRCSFLVEEID